MEKRKPFCPDQLHDITMRTEAAPGRKLSFHAFERYIRTVPHILKREFGDLEDDAIALATNFAYVNTCHAAGVDCNYIVLIEQAVSRLPV